MTLTLSTILLLLAFVCFVISAMGVPSPRLNLQSAGLALLTLAMIVGTFGLGGVR